MPLAGATLVGASSLTGVCVGTRDLTPIHTVWHCSGTIEFAPFIWLRPRILLQLVESQRSSWIRCLIR